MTVGPIAPKSRECEAPATIRRTHRGSMLHCPVPSVRVPSAPVAQRSALLDWANTYLPEIERARDVFDGA